MPAPQHHPKVVVAVEGDAASGRARPSLEPPTAFATSESPQRQRSVGARALLVLIRAYQGVSRYRSPACRFVPSCSEYAAEAIQRHGVVHGMRLATGRLLRCRPGGPFGYDPVPDPEEAAR